MNAILAAALFFALIPPAQAGPDPKRAAQCQKKIELAHKTQMLYDLKLQGSTLIVYVGPTYFNVPINAKEGLADTLSCVLMKGDPKMLAEFTLAHWQSGKRVGRYHNGRLEIE